MQKLVKMVEREHDTMIRELSLASGQLAVVRVRTDMAEASMVVMSSYFDKSIAE